MPFPIQTGAKFQLEVKPSLPVEVLGHYFRGFDTRISLPLRYPGGEEIAILWFVLENLPTLDDAYQFASMIQQWWTLQFRQGHTPEGKIKYKEGDRELVIELKGENLDLNKLADTFFKQVKKLEN